MTEPWISTIASEPICPAPALHGSRWTWGGFTCLSALWRWPSTRNPRRRADDQKGSSVASLKTRQWENQPGYTRVIQGVSHEIAWTYMNQLVDEQSQPWYTLVHRNRLWFRKCFIGSCSGLSNQVTRVEPRQVIFDDITLTSGPGRHAWTSRHAKFSSVTDGFGMVPGECTTINATLATVAVLNVWLITNILTTTIINQIQALSICGYVLINHYQ